MNEQGWMEKTEKFEIRCNFIPGIGFHFSGNVNNLSELKHALKLLQLRIEHELTKREGSSKKRVNSSHPEEMLFPVEFRNISGLPVIRSQSSGKRQKESSRKRGADIRGRKSA